jgi:hypothetical protein
MSNVTATESPVTARRVRDARSFRRVAAAVLLPIPALCIAVGSLIRPGYSATDTASTLDAIAADSTAQRAFVWLGAIAMLTLVPAFIAAARLARRRRPVLATVAAGVNVAAYLGVALGFGSADVYQEVAARPEFDQAELAGYLDAVAAHGVSGLSVGLFVIGHIIGMILLGVARGGSSLAGRASR